MPTTSAVTKIRRTKATSTVTPQAGTVQPKTTPAISSKPHTALQKLKATAGQVKSPEDIARFLNQMQTNSDQSTVGARTSPVTQGGAIIPGLSWTAGTAKLVQHNLGRNPNGYLIVRSKVPTVASVGATAGTLYNQSSDSQTISVAGGTPYTTITYAHTGLSTGVALNAGAGTITVTSAGTYLIVWTGAVQLAANDPMFIGIFINGTQTNDANAQWNANATVVNQPVAIATLKQLSANDVVDCRLTFSGAGPQNAILTTSNFSVFGAPSSGSSGGIALTEAALPAGYDATVALNLVPSATGTGDLWVF